MREHDISGVPVVEGDTPGRHPHGARHPLREEPRSAGERAHDEGARHGAARRLERRSASELLHKHRIEKLLVVEDGKLVGLITIKDLLQAERNPLAIEGRQGPPARRRRHRPGPRSRRARRRARRGRRRRHRRRHRARSLARASSTPCARRRSDYPERRAHRRQRRDRRGDRGAHRRRRRRREGRHRPRQHLHDARRRRRRRPADHRHRRLRARRRSPRRPDHRRRRREVLGRRHQGDRRRRLDAS